MTDKRKPREHGILITLDKATVVNGFLIGPDGYLSLAKDGVPIVPASASVELAYDRPQGRKVLLRAPIDPTNPNIDPNSHLSRYRSVFAIDTNTVSIGDRLVSVACVCRLSRAIADGNTIGIVPIGAYELHNVTCNPDHLSWRLLCEEILHAPDYHDGQGDVGIFVDSHLGSLDDVNRRVQRILQDWHLPPDIVLLYATDAAADTIGNQLIKTCDREASAILRMVREGRTTNPIQVADPGEYYSHFRSWKWTSNR